MDDLTINSSGRLEAIRQGDLAFLEDKKDLETYLPIVAEASKAKATSDRLARYKVAKKRPVVTSVQRVRFETRRGWDTLSQSCELWYESPIGCPATRRVEVPYTEKVTVMQYPEGIASPTEVLKGFQDRYFELLTERRRASAQRAQMEREEIAAGNVTGWTGLSQSLFIFGAFLVLMFFFLLVAIERHQRRISARLPQMA